jgi:hypothetical protein
MDDVQKKFCRKENKKMKKVRWMFFALLCLPSGAAGFCVYKFVLKK